MGLENAQYIHQLLEQNPTTQDKMKQGDDHLRMVKKTIKNTFPEVQGPVTVSHTTLNSIPPLLNQVIAELISHLPRKGAIISHDPQMPIPGGWAICDGSTVPGYGVVPDLRGKFLKGASLGESPGFTGGALTATTSTQPGHGHQGATGGHALALNEMPAHAHPLSENILTEGVAGAGFGGATSGNSGPPGETGSVGGTAEHEHPISLDGEHAHTVATQPPFYVLVFIVKVTEYEAPT